MKVSKLNIPSPIQALQHPSLTQANLALDIKRDDLIHPFVSGNKWRKLKFNFKQCQAEDKDTLLTFGGAYSNHIAATAYAGNQMGVKTVGVIRGDEFNTLNTTLDFAQKNGMYLHFVSRSDYKKKSESYFLEELKALFGDVFIIPEGGANWYGVQGCYSILEEVNQPYDFICCAAGTGTTAAGIFNSKSDDQKLVVFPAIKGAEELINDIIKWKETPDLDTLAIITDYHFGGYAKLNNELINFANEFYLNHQIPLDLIYTAKMMYGLFNLIEKKYFPKNSRILVIHSGGLQGNEGFVKKGVKLVY